MTITVDRERTAGVLLNSSARRSFDPVVDVDWQAPLHADRLCVPAHRLSLSGTAEWEGLSAGQRVILTRHEISSVASVGVWFELILMQMLVRHMYGRDPRAKHVQYGLTEIADECRHSVMFGRMIERLDAPAYGPGRRQVALGRLFKATSSQLLTFSSALFVEEILDSWQREIMRDESMEPMVRQVCRIHVIEEARHMRYAREELARQWAHTPRLLRPLARMSLAIACVIAAGHLVHPGVYTAVGLPARHTRRVAQRNAVWRDSKRSAARRAIETFESIGMIGVVSRRIWRRAGLLG